MVKISWGVGKIKEILLRVEMNYNLLNITVDGQRPSTGKRTFSALGMPYICVSLSHTLSYLIFTVTQ